MSYDEEGEEGEELGVAGVFGVDPDAPPDEGVLPHQDDGVGTEAGPDVLKLVGSNIVGQHDQHLAVLVQQRAKPLVVLLLLLRLRHLYRHLSL